MEVRNPPRPPEYVKSGIGHAVPSIGLPTFALSRFRDKSEVWFRVIRGAWVGLSLRGGATKQSIRMDCRAHLRRPRNDQETLSLTF